LGSESEGKLKQIHKLINQFTSSIQHKPFANELDKARTLGFIRALRNVITAYGSKPMIRPQVYQVEIGEPVSKEKQQKAIQQARQKIRKESDGNIQEPVSE
jgi:hypothetical protein